MGVNGLPGVVIQRGEPSLICLAKADEGIRDEMAAKNDLLEKSILDFFLGINFNPCSF